MTNGQGFSADLPGKDSARQSWQHAQEQATQALRQAAKAARMPESVTGHAALSDALGEFADRLEQLGAPVHEQLGNTETQLGKISEAYQHADQDAANKLDRIDRSNQNGGGHA